MNYQVSQLNEHCRGSFQAMASPCEILVETDSVELTEKLTQIAHQEALRIQSKFSRYDKRSLCSRINNANLSTHDSRVKIDDETFQLLEFANQCFEISNGLFDITSGILGKVWKFDGSSSLPANEDVEALLKFIGWAKVIYDSEQILLPQGMEIDFGGIAKEYAVDRTAKLISQQLKKVALNVSVLINFGGDLIATSSKADGSAWTVGIESPANQNNAPGNLCLVKGALATSGDARRFQLKDGVRYGHILNPKTGWPIAGAPASVTVAAFSCVTAGMLATMALLEGDNAEDFLKQQQLDYWIIK